MTCTKLDQIAFNLHKKGFLTGIILVSFPWGKRETFRFADYCLDVH